MMFEWRSTERRKAKKLENRERHWPYPFTLRVPAEDLIMYEKEAPSLLLL